jgi:hypothetical protein
VGLASYLRVAPALDAMELNSKCDVDQEGQNSLLAVEKTDPSSEYNTTEQIYEMSGKDYLATGASFMFTINVQFSVIMALNVKGLRYAGQERDPVVEGSDLPDLRKLSDVAWIK